MPLLRAEAGSRPACEALFFASPKKSTQKKGDPTVCVPCASLRGNLWCSGLAGSRSNSLRFTSLRQSRALIRQTLRSSAHPEGQGSRTSTRAIASLGPRIAGASASRCAIQAERSDGPYGCWAVGLLGCWAVGLLGCWAATPLLYAPGARRRRGGVGVPQDTPALRQLTRRVCLNGAPQARSELRGAPRIRAPQVAP